MKRAWASLRLLEKAGKGSAVSHALETRVANALVIASEGGFAFGSPEHMAVLKRMQELGASGRQRRPVATRPPNPGASRPPALSFARTAHSNGGRPLSLPQ